MKFKKFEDIKDDFDILGDWEERYAYIIELGRDMPILEETLRTDENKVIGCASQVWLYLNAFDENGTKKLSFIGDSDAMIVKGLIAIIGSIYDEANLNDLPKIDPFNKFMELDLLSHLSSQRSNGLNSMIKKIQKFS